MAVWKYLFGILPFIRIALPVPLIDDDGVPELQWPQKYKIDIIKVFVDVGLEETLTVWHDKTSKQTRVDYNKGVVKQFYIKQGDDNETIKEETAESRSLWQYMGEAYVQQWTSKGRYDYH